MDTKSFLDDLLKSGATLAGKGQAIAEDKLQIPAEGAERNAQIDGMKKGAMAAGVLALLLGTKSGRKLSGSALKIGSLAAIGGIGYKAYQNWASEKNATEQQYKDMAQDIGRENSDRGTLVNFDTMDAISKLGLGDETASLIQNEIAKPLDVKEVAALASDQAMAAEIYLVSTVITDRENSMEREYLASLATEMGLPDALVVQLQEVKEESTA